MNNQKLRAREIWPIPVIKSLVVPLWMWLIIAIQSAIFPVKTLSSGENIGLILTSWFIGLIALLVAIFPLVAIWLSWFRKGFRFSGRDQSLLVQQPQFFGLDAFDDRFFSGDWRPEARWKILGLEKFFVRVHIDDRRASGAKSDLTLWLVWRRDFDWLESLPHLSEEEAAAKAENGENGKGKSTAGDKWLLNALKLLIGAFGNPQMVKSMRFLEGIATGADHKGQRATATKWLEAKELERNLPSAPAADPDPGE